jgi:hypothetical protein
MHAIYVSARNIAVNKSTVQEFFDKEILPLQIARFEGAMHILQGLRTFTLMRVPKNYEDGSYQRIGIFVIPENSAAETRWKRETVTVIYL